MKTFKWLLNWSLPSIYMNENDIIPVRQNGIFIGKCKIAFDGNKIVGNFTISEDLDNSQYVLYTISIPNELNEIYLEGILLVDYYDGLDKRARKVENMIMI